MKNNRNCNKLIKTSLMAMFFGYVCIEETRGSQNPSWDVQDFEKAYKNFIIRPARLKIVELDIKHLEESETLEDPLQKKYGQRQQDWRSLMSTIYQQAQQMMKSQELDVAWHVALNTFKKKFWGFHFEDVPLNVDRWVAEYNFTGALTINGDTFNLCKIHYPLLLAFFKEAAQIQEPREDFKTSER